MKFTDFPLVVSNQDDKNYTYIYMGHCFLYLQIINRRIDKQTFRYFKYKNFNPRKEGHAKLKLTLDIKTMFIYSKLYLDFLARYIHQNFFNNIAHLVSSSYHQHVNSLVKVNTNNQIFNDYKNYILKNGLKFVYRIGLLRDKLLSHRLLDSHETILVDSVKNKIGLSIERIRRTKEQENPIIKDDLKNDILRLAQQYDISILEQEATNLHDFEYFDNILKKIEETALNCPINMEIGITRQRLGGIFDSTNVFTQLFEFTMDLKKIFNTPEILLTEFPDEW